MKDDLKDRTFRLSVDVINLVELLPNSKASNVVSYQLVKSGTSVGANYRAAKRARSDKEFISKINIVLEEVDETLFWLEIIKTKEWINSEEISKLLNEANELTAIFVSILKKVNKRLYGVVRNGGN